MDGRIKVGVAALALGVALGLAVPGTAESPSGVSERRVTVTGRATVRTAPDEAVVSMGVHTRADGAKAAMAQNADLMNQVIDALVVAGVSKDDIATTSVNLYPRYGEHGQSIVGYSAENQVDVIVRDLGIVGDVIDGAVAAGANLAGGIQFRLSSGNPGDDRALEAAVADARHKAEVFAEAAGATLGQVISIEEAGRTNPPPVAYERVAFAAAPTPTPVLPGDIETGIVVTVVWALS